LLRSETSNLTIKMKEKDTLMTANEVCQYLKISRQTLWRRLKKGEVPGIKLGGQWRFKRGEIEKYFMADAIAQPRYFKIEVLSKYLEAEEYQVQRIKNSGTLITGKDEMIYYTFMKLKDGTEIILMPTTELAKMPLLENEHWIRHEYR
jgi:excisionase family DNA binding protein